ncbi:Hydroxyacid oxidase 1 [Holothuria leucospilota]|uniref:(S)-2-hydroxy-acid oxidase n=1 Tax=Holothuria leucospilota TaxID=206669 RepID=A0A9Q0YR44_HOLLE|nr:Hydroxyacid oxidase 1 [Holothuria leucospilota]
MSAPESLRDFERIAEEKIKDKNPNLWMYISHASGDRQTYDESLRSFKRFYLQPQVLTVRQKPSTWTTLLGNPVRIPICISPVAGQINIIEGGDVLTGKATSRAGTLMVYTSVSAMKIEDFGKIVPQGHFWAQTYLFRDKRNTLHIVRNAEQLGFKALVITVDSPVDFTSNSGKNDIEEWLDTSERNEGPNLIYLNGKERDNKRLGDKEMWHPQHGLGHHETFCHPTWQDLAWLKSQTKLPIVLKGILTAKAARRAVSAGINGILVSAHGGRQLEGTTPPLMALQEVVEAVKGSGVEVYMDGGVRSGSDVFKAMALGARAVFVGRAALWALAVNGEDGVRRLLQILEDEFTTTMTMCGCPSLQDIDSSCVKHESQFKDVRSCFSYDLGMSKVLHGELGTVNLAMDTLEKKNLEPENIHEFERFAEAKLKTTKGYLWSYIRQASGDRQTYDESIRAFKRYFLQPQILTVREKPSTWTTLLGNPVRIPICISPVAGQVSVIEGGDVLTGNATARAGTLMVFSSSSSMKLEDFGRRVPQGLFWAQMYLYRDKRNILNIVRNAERLGFKALVITVDSPVDFMASSGKSDIMHWMDPTEMNGVPNLSYLDGKERENQVYTDEMLWHPENGFAQKETFCMPTWQDLAWLKSQTKLPIVLKGILTAKAARRAVSAGIDGILVSAHGGRQLEGSPPPLMALPEVVEAVKGSGVEVYVDGGVRSGSDVFKAMALGARAVFVGRPTLWALAVNGGDGVRRMLRLLEDEFTTTMTMCGCQEIKDIDSSFVKHQSHFQSKL